MKKTEFPKVVRVGQTKATIYKTPSHGCDSYTVVWYVGAVRNRKAFAELELAEAHAQSQVNSLSLGEAEIIRLSGEERLAYVRAREAVKEFGLALDTAASEYRDAKRLIRGRSLVEVARYYAAQRLLDLPAKTVTEVYQEMLQTKRSEGLSRRYLKDLESRVGRFARDFQRQISAVTGQEIKAWLQALTRELAETPGGSKGGPVSNRTRNNFRMGIQTLFAFAKGQGYLPLDWKGLESVPVLKVANGEVEIFTADELKVLLSVAPGNLVPFLTIGAFAGLRTAEIERLDWSKVNLESGYITVDASIAKTNSRRLVPIAANLKLWLKDHKKPHGPVLDIANMTNVLRRLVDATRPPVDPKEPEKVQAPRVEWKHNALRHSFCGYRLASVKSAAEVALEAGNSPQMIFRHYRELVTEKEAKAWFAVAPDGKSEGVRAKGKAPKPGNVIELATAVA